MSTGRRTTLLATAALLGMTATWGSTFYLIHDLLDRVPTLDFLAVRFALAGVLMLAIAPRAVTRLGARSRRAALGLGVLYGLAQILQTAGLAHTPASVSGFVTGMYVVATPLTWERSVATVAHNLRRAVEIGAEGVVVHTGSYVDPTGSREQHDAALRRVRDGLLPVLESLGDDDAPWLLLEPTAGQGQSLCAGVDDLEAYLAALDLHPRAGVCLDTCHVFAAGAPLDEPGGATATVDRIVEIAGPGRLRLVHANDSMDVRGACKDRHERIGEGHIGTDAFRELFAHPATAGVPFILETPGSRDPGNPDREVLRRLRAEAAA